MVQMRRPAGEVLYRRQAREAAEIVGEVRLIVIAAMQGEVGQIEALAAREGRNDPLESPDPQEAFGRESDLVGEELVEVALAVTDAGLGFCRERPLHASTGMQNNNSLSAFKAARQPRLSLMILPS